MIEHQNVNPNDCSFGGIKIKEGLFLGDVSAAEVSLLG